MLASKELFTFFRLLLKDFSAAQGTFARHFVDDALGIFTLRITGAGQKFAETAVLNHHLSSALLADDVRFLIRDTIAYSFGFHLGLFKIFFKSVVKAVQNLRPLFIAVRNFIKIFFHISGKIRVYNLRKVLLHQLSRHFAKLRRLELLALALDIVSP